MRQEKKYIYQVYQEGSFSKAAEKLYLTQPALSLAIQRIEQEVGMPLFNRNSRPMTLTAAGQIYIDTIEKELLLEQEMNQQLRDIRDLNSGYIRLGGSHYLNAYIMPQILPEFSMRHPQIQIELHERGSAELAQMLVERKLDLTFSCNADFVKDFPHYPAFSDHILLAVPKANPINRLVYDRSMSAKAVFAGQHLSEDCPTVPLTLFREQEFILLRPGNNLYDRSLQMFRDAGFDPKIRMELSQLVTAYRFACHGVAITFVSDRLVEPHNDSLCYYKLDCELTNRLFYLLTPKNTYTSFATRAFIQHFIDSMK